MAMQGECICTGAPRICPKCKTEAQYDLAFLPRSRSVYIASYCRCGQYSRETEYFDTVQEGLENLELLKQTGNCAKLRNTNFNPNGLTFETLSENATREELENFLLK